MKKITNAFLLFTALMMFVGCYTEKKAKRQVTKAQAQYPAIVAGYCGSWYPPREYDSTRIEYRAGKTDTVIRHDSTYIKGDTVFKVTVKYITKHDTVFQDRFKSIENTARVSALQQQSSAIQDKLSKTEQKVIDKANTIKKLWFSIAGLSLLVIVLGLLITKKFIP